MKLSEALTILEGPGLSGDQVMKNLIVDTLHWFENDVRRFDGHLDALEKSLSSRALRIDPGLAKKVKTLVTALGKEVDLFDRKTSRLLVDAKK